MKIFGFLLNYNELYTIMNEIECGDGRCEGLCNNEIDMEHILDFVITKEFAKDGFLVPKSKRNPFMDDWIVLKILSNEQVENMDLDYEDRYIVVGIEIPKVAEMTLIDKFTLWLAHTCRDYPSLAPFRSKLEFYDIYDEFDF
jgi:hypothetical protein